MELLQQLIQPLADYYASLDPNTRLIGVLGLIMSFGLFMGMFFWAGDPELLDRPNHLYPLGYRRHVLLNLFRRWF
jgi:hypothetical protein